MGDSTKGSAIQSVNLHPSLSQSLLFTILYSPIPYELLFIITIAPYHMFPYSKQQSRSISPLRTLTAISNMVIDFVRVISPSSATSERSRTPALDATDSDFARHYVSFPGLDSQVSDVTLSDLDSNYSDSQRVIYKN